MNDEQLMSMQGLLEACLSADNVARKAAEDQITNHLNSHREIFIFGLIKLIRTSPSTQVRVLCAIILRQTLPKGDTVVFLKLQPSLQEGIRTELLAAIVSETDRYVRTQISDTIASLASVLIYNNNWPGLFSALYSMADPAQPNDGLKMCALTILGKLSDAADNLLPEVVNLHRVFQFTLTPNNSLAVRAEACVACCKIVGIIEEKAHTAEYEKFAPLFLATLNDALARRDEDLAKQVLCALTEVATEEGKFFEKSLDKLVPLMHAIGADTYKMDLEDGIRQYALEVLLAMGESSPTMARKSTAYIKASILVCMSLMHDVEEDAEWGQKNDSNDFYDNSNFDAGEHCMDRLSLVVQQKRLWPILEPILNEHCANKNDWKSRHAGLFGLAQTCSVLRFKDLPVKAIAKFVKDPHPRVRFAAVQCLGQFPVDFEVVTQTTHHKVIFPALMDVLGDFQNPRTQAHAATALFNMVDGCPGKIIKKYVPALMERSIALLKQGHKMVQIQVMPVMAGIAGQAPKTFMPYYDTVVPMMIYIIEKADSADTRMLRARAMEAVSYIGMYVGNEKFHNDAKRIVELFLHIMQKSKATSSSKLGRALGSSDDDYTEQHMLQAWTRICACLKSEFVPILPYVMPMAFEAITSRQANDITNRQVHKIADDSNGGDADGDGDEEDLNVDKTGMVRSISTTISSGDGISDKPITMSYTSHAHTAAMEEMASAMSMVCTFCFDLREHYMPYVKQTAELFIPLLEHNHSEVQAHAIDTMPQLMRSAMSAHKINQASTDFVKVLFEAIVVQTVSVFPKEIDARVLQLMIVSLQECIECVSLESPALVRQVIDAPMLLTIGKALLTLLEASHERIRKREERIEAEIAADEMDEERIYEFETRNASEDGLNNQAAALINSLIKSHGEYFLPVFDQLFPEILRMLSVNSLDSTKKIAIFVLDDVFEFGGPAIAKYFPQTLESMCIYATTINMDIEVRQAAAYGLAMAAKHGGAAFQPFLEEIAKRLIAAVQADPVYLKRTPEDEIGEEFIPTSADDEGQAAPVVVDEESEDAVAPADEEDEEEEEEEEEDATDPEEENERRTTRLRLSSVDNIVNAIASIARFQTRPDLLPIWLSFLPLRVDDAEGPTAYNFLLDLIESNNPLILGENFANLPRVLSIFLSTVNTNFLKNKALRARVGKFFTTVKSMPEAMLKQVVAAMPPHEQAKLVEIFKAIQ